MNGQIILTPYLDRISFVIPVDETSLVFTLALKDACRLRSKLDRSIDAVLDQHWKDSVSNDLAIQSHEN